MGKRLKYVHDINIIILMDGFRHGIIIDIKEEKK